MRKETEGAERRVSSDALRPACAKRQQWPELEHLAVPCCDICHSVYPEHDLRQVNLEIGQGALVCCAVERALFPASASPESEASALKMLKETFAGFTHQ